MVIMKRGKIMILTIDVGNSNTVIVGYENNQIVYKKRIITEKIMLFRITRPILNRWNSILRLWSYQVLFQTSQI